MTGIPTGNLPGRGGGPELRPQGGGPELRARNAGPEVKFEAYREVQAKGSQAPRRCAASSAAQPIYPVNRVVYWLLQWTWGLIQNLVGLVLAAGVRAGHPERRLSGFHGAVVVPWERGGGSMGLGMFIFYGHRGRPDAAEVLVHEYGHTIQSAILGPLYLFVIGLPSLLWAWLRSFRYRRAAGMANFFVFFVWHTDKTTSTICYTLCNIL